MRSDPGVLNDDAVFTTLGGAPRADRWFYDSHIGLGVVGIDLTKDL